MPAPSFDEWLQQALDSGTLMRDQYNRVRVGKNYRAGDLDNFRDAPLSDRFNTKGLQDYYAKFIGNADSGGDGAAAVADAPAPPPDITDEVLTKAKRRQALSLMIGQGRRSTFLTGDLGAPQIGKTLLGGG